MPGYFALQTQPVDDTHQLLRRHMGTRRASRKIGRRITAQRQGACLGMSGDQVGHHGVVGRADLQPQRRPQTAGEVWQGNLPFRGRSGQQQRRSRLLRGVPAVEQFGFVGGRCIVHHHTPMRGGKPLGKQRLARTRRPHQNCGMKWPCSGVPQRLDGCAIGVADDNPPRPGASAQRQHNLDHGLGLGAPDAQRPAAHRHLPAMFAQSGGELGNAAGKADPHHRRASNRNAARRC